MAANPTPLSTELAIFQANKKSWLSSRSGQYVVIKGVDIVGFYGTFADAFYSGAQRFGSNAEFLVKKIVEQEPVFMVF